MVDCEFTNEPIVIFISAVKNHLLSLLPAASLKTTAEPAITVAAQSPSNGGPWQLPWFVTAKVGYKGSFQDIEIKQLETVPGYFGE